MEKWFKRIFICVGGIVVGLPVLLIGFIIFVEGFGFFANHAATDRQTRELKSYIMQEVDDAQITDEYSETGNTSGTGNHVDCLSRISFSSGESPETISGIFEKNYEYWDLTNEDGVYTVTLNTSAPFPDNFEGH